MCIPLCFRRKVVTVGPLSSLMVRYCGDFIRGVTHGHGRPRGLHLFCLSNDSGALGLVERNVGPQSQW